MNQIIDESEKLTNTIQVNFVRELLYDELFKEMGEEIENYEFPNITSALLVMLIEINRGGEEVSYADSIENIIRWLLSLKPAVEGLERHCDFSEVEVLEKMIKYVHFLNKEP